MGKIKKTWYTRTCIIILNSLKRTYQLSIVNMYFSTHMIFTKIRSTLKTQFKRVTYLKMPTQGLK